MKQEIKKILSEPVKIEEYEERKIVYLGKKSFEKLWDLREEKVKELIESGLNRVGAIKYAYGDIFKIINPHKAPIRVLAFGLGINYSMVSDKEKIISKYIERDFYIWANKKRKELKKYIKEQETDETKISSFMQKIENEIKQKEEILKDIISHPQKYELLRCNYFFKEVKYVPFIYLFDYHTEKSKKVYLKKDVLNVVYEENEPIKKKRRKSKIEERLSDMENIFGYIYIKERE